VVKAIDISGQRFGRLIAIKPDNSKRPANSTRLYWLCKCDCGNYSTTSGADLRSGKVRSCGCLHDEMASLRFYKHGQSGSKLSMVWQAMKQRCGNSHCKDFPSYGGRGINVCHEWQIDFATFYDWAITNGYHEGLSIDRIDVDGNYEPMNCRWVNMKVQANNERKNHRISFKGETHTLAEWAEITGQTQSTLSARINRYRWPLDKALTIKPKIGRNQYDQTL
jgi:hypothetical protein